MGTTSRIGVAAFVWLSLAGLSLSCGPVNAAAPGNQSRYGQVPVAVGIGAAGAAISRAAGGCYAVCAYGTVCNPDTGACVPMPAGQEDQSSTVPGLNYGLVDPGAPGLQSGAPIPEPPRAPPPSPTVAPPPGPVCPGGCKTDEYCALDRDGKSACVRRGPVPLPAAS